MDNLKKLIAILQRFLGWKETHKTGWYGTILISIEDSNIVNVKVTENIKL